MQSYDLESISIILIRKGAFMDAVKSINDFKRFIELNRDKLYANAENADNITLDDEWMQEDQWDEIYKQEEKKKDVKI